VSDGKFIVAPSSIWNLSDRIVGDRKSRLLTFAYDRIIGDLVSDFEVDEVRCVRSWKRPECHRIEIAIFVPSRIVDVFHNGAGGYRAQFWRSPQLGEMGNRTVLDMIALRLAKLRRGRRDIDFLWPTLFSSISSAAAKIWIQENDGSGWRDDTRPEKLDLFVEDWTTRDSEFSISKRVVRNWSKLAPEHVSYVDIKGGWLNRQLEPIETFKPQRSIEIHSIGYT
jgi:hypothetical protein